MRLWFLDRLDRGSATYNIPFAHRLRGELSVDGLGRALAEIVRRHESLRTRFAAPDGEPMQEILPPEAVPLPVEDLSGYPDHDREPEATRRSEAEAHIGFDLERGPLFRFRLLRLSERDHLLLMTFHHIIFDGWSEGVFFRELAALYASTLKQEPSSLPEPALQYPDYALWQRRAFEGGKLSHSLAYWKRTLAGVPPLLDLPTDFPRPAVPASLGSEKTLAIEKEIYGALVELSRRENVTLFLTLLTVFNVLLHRYSGQDDIVVGTPVAGRHHHGTETAIGFFVNTLALRTDCAGEPTFLQLLRRVRETVLGAFDNQDVPFEKVVEAVCPERQASVSPLVQILFALQKLGVPFTSMDGLTVTDVHPALRRAKFDLVMSVMESEGGIVLGAEYSTGLFEERTIRNMLRHFDFLLRSVVSAPEGRISDLRMIDQAGEEELVALGTGHSVSFPIEQTFPQAFESVVRETPRATALCAGPGRLSYRDLNARANRIGNVLRREGVIPNSVVGVWMDRCLDLPAAFLGILKSGAAFLPLDPSYPAERLSYMLSDSGVPLTLTLRRFLPAIPPYGGRVICLDDEAFTAGGGGGPDEADPPPVSGPGDLAYVIYTSGSTGRPKGVEISHRSLLNHNFGIVAAHALSGSDRVLQFYSPCFDAAIEDMFPSWLAGAAVVLRPEESTSSMNRFLAFIDAERITVLRASTAFWHELADCVTQETFPRSVRLVVVGGEKLRSDRVEAWRRKIGPRVRVLNLYGPTETTVAATSCDVLGRRPDGLTPIGRPLPNVYVRILDRSLRQVPAGISGEICIGGIGVSRGYRNNPGLTAERFIADPHGAATGLRLYRTGDRGRFLPDGNIDFEGRIDNQVKVRGYRIEPGEIESVLASHPSVTHAVVKAAADRTGNNFLAAYIVLRGKPADNSGAEPEIASWLRTRLPEYMIPQRIITVDTIPLLPNGKTDLSALPPPRMEESVRGEAYAAPRDPLESQLVAIWEEVLGRSPVGIHDNFFSLGGHSLLAARLFGLIERRMGKNLPLATMFQAPTVDQFAAVLRSGGWQGSWSSLVPIKTGGSNPPFFCIHALGGNVIGYTELARSLPEDQPVYGLQAAGLDGKEHPASTVEEMAALYVKEIRSLQPSGPYHLGGACTGGIVAYEMARQLLAHGEEVGLLAMFDTFAHSHFRSLSKTELREFKWKKFRDRVRYHGTNILLRRGRIAYLRKKFTTIRRRISTRIWGLLYAQYTRLKLPLPAALQKVEEYQLLAIKNYEIRPYPGRVTLFPPGTKSIGEYEDREQGWGSFAQGGVEIHDVQGDHLTMLREPHVKIVAEELALCLRRAYQSHAVHA
jgi:aspartate racemase